MRHDIQTLRLFIAAYEERSIAKAAQRENIVPSALSKRLSDLEASLRVTLFHRHRNGLEPTAAANAVLHHARLVMHELLQMESELLDFGAGLKGQVRIHANVWAIVEYLPDDLASFAAEHPLVRIDLEENISSGIIRAIGENAADIGVLASSVPTPGLHVIHIALTGWSRSCRKTILLQSGRASGWRTWLLTTSSVPNVVAPWTDCLCRRRALSDCRCACVCVPQGSMR